MQLTKSYLFLLILFFPVLFIHLEISAKDIPPYTMNDYIDEFQHQPDLYVDSGQVLLDLSAAKLTEKYIEHLGLTQRETQKLINILHLSNSTDHQSTYSSQDIARKLTSRPPITKKERNELLKDENLSNVKCVQLTSLDGLEHINPHGITVLNLNGNELHSIDLERLSRFTHLQTLSLSNNKIERLPSGGFQGLQHLKRLNLSRNRIRDIHQGMFTHLDNLTHLYLSHNKIETFRADGFQGLQCLKKLYLNGNRIREVHKGMFPHLDPLTHIDLSHNKIEFLSGGGFQGLENIKKLYLKGNRVQEIHQETFTHLDQLTHLDLTDNKVRKVARYSFLFLPYLETLNISSNRLTLLPQHVFYGPSNLQQVNLHNNPLDLSDIKYLNDITNSIQTLSIDLELVEFLPVPTLNCLSKLDVYPSSEDTTSSEALRSLWQIPSSVNIQVINW